MKKRKFKKTLIEPKVRLLLWIHLHGVKDESNYLAQLADKIDYSEGSIKSHLLSDLLDKGLIESLSPDKESPPFRTTKEAKKFLEPVFMVRKLGYISLFYLFSMFSLLVGWYIYNPALLVLWWVPITIFGFLAICFVLVLYPQILLKLGKMAYSSSE